MQKSGIVAYLPPIYDLNDVCEACMKGKQHMQPFPQESSTRAEAPLQLVHAYLSIKMNTQALGGSSYYFALIDDYSRKTWVYFLREKSQAFGKFKEWLAMVEAETGRKLKKLRTDRGGEFLFGEFTTFCKERGIKRQLTNPHTPQQNGVAKQKNHTIMEMARIMLKVKGLPNSFWAEVVNTTVYILN